MWQAFRPRLLLFVFPALLSTACDAVACGRSKTYEGTDLLPDSELQAGELIAALQAGATLNVTWDPEADVPLHDWFSAAPFSGPDVVTVSVRFPEPEFQTDPSYDIDYGCSYPLKADVLLFIESQSGRLRARVPSTFSMGNGSTYVSGALGHLEGPARGFEPNLPGRDWEVKFDIELDDQGAILWLRVEVWGDTARLVLKS